MLISLIILAGSVRGVSGGLERRDRRVLLVSASKQHRRCPWRCRSPSAMGQEVRRCRSYRGIKLESGPGSRESPW
ncbi:hypothetical protein C8F04DRAFT_1087401 [Mycena alexandri]|uniref:Secreted protein n=1 Tax=Mycena alexandri TaxID=1745969 RepID=A0AAD6T646_9AGAR|nr:hypothetical protein C8F04DRAFT_1087401 [Mycena alexandri]